MGGDSKEALAYIAILGCAGVVFIGLAMALAYGTATNEYIGAPDAAPAVIALAVLGAPIVAAVTYVVTDRHAPASVRERIAAGNRGVGPVAALTLVAPVVWALVVVHILG